MTGRRIVGPLLALLVVLVAAGWLSSSLRGDSSSPDSSPGSSTGSSAGSSSGPSGSVDPDSGLAYVSTGQLPAQARTTLALIDAGGPYPFPGRDDVTFRNDQGVLPRERGGYYREYTVITPGSADRGARRIVAGSGGELYYTDDHYTSFERIRR